MPRSESSNLTALLGNSDASDTLELVLSNGTTKRLAHKPLVILGNSYQAHFGEVGYIGGDSDSAETCGVGSLAQALGVEVDRVEVKIQNVDEVIGADVVSATRKLAYAIGRVGKYFENTRNPLIVDHRIMFDGIIAGASTSERAATLQIISDRVAAGQCIAVKTLSPSNGWTLPETSIPTPPTSTGGGGGGVIRPPYCFTAENLVWTPRGDVPIIEIVNSFLRGRKWTVYCFDPVTHSIYETDVVKVFHESVPVRELLDYKFEHGGMRLTEKHNLETPGGKCEAGKLQASYPVFGVDEISKEWIHSRITNFNWDGSNRMIDVFNFEAARWHTYFISHGRMKTPVYNRKDDTDIFL